MQVEYEIDHLVVAGPDLGAAVAWTEARLGALPVPGGRHLGLGTHNALLGLGQGTYLEVIGPDPDQPEPAGPRPFGIDGRTAPGLVGVAVRASGAAFDQLLDELAAAGIEMAPAEMSRTRPDGVVLEWRVARPVGEPIPGLFTFAIDWGSSPHPSDALEPVARLSGLRVEHPDVEAATRAASAFGIACDVVAGEAPGLVAHLTIDDREVELR